MKEWTAGYSMHLETVIRTQSSRCVIVKANSQSIYGFSPSKQQDLRRKAMKLIISFKYSILSGMFPIRFVFFLLRVSTLKTHSTVLLMQGNLCTTFLGEIAYNKEESLWKLLVIRQLGIISHQTHDKPIN